MRTWEKNRIYSVCVKQHEDALRVLKATKLLTEDGEIGEKSFRCGKCGRTEPLLPQGISARRFSCIRLHQ